MLLNEENLKSYLASLGIQSSDGALTIREFKHGQSNPTYYVRYGGRDLVLRKKPVIFLHVFHHGIMTLMPYLWLRGNWTVTWFGCFLNCFIHIWMYLHYAMSAALGPKRWNPWWKRHLTGLQIVQFILVFLIICLFVATIRIVGTPCQGDLSIVWTSQAVNLVFLFFFVKFFIDAYGAKKKANTKKKE